MDTLRATSRAARALLLLALLAAVIVGLPWGLWHFFGPPLPDHVPGYGDVRAWLDQVGRQPDQAAIQVLDVGAWGYWALFTAQIAIQVPGVTADTCHALRTRSPFPTTPPANVAGRLLAGIAISILATRGTVTTASAATNHSSPTAAATTATSMATTNTTVYVVEGDSLWGIAEQHLGDPQRWREIYQLNRHRVQPDGGVLTEPDVIRPGWILSLPSDATAPAKASDTPSPATSELPARPLPHVQVPSPPPLRQGTSTTAASPIATRPGSSPTPSASPHQAPPVVRRPIAVHLPTGGYVSLTLGAGLAAALAAASIRARVNARRRMSDDPVPEDETERASEPEGTLLQAAATLGYGRDVDPYIDEPDCLPPIPQALTPLRAPTAVYIGSRDGCPIALQLVAAGGLGLCGGGAHDTARAVLASALSAGGFLAGSAVYQVITTTDDLLALAGTELTGRANDRLTAYATFDEALAAIMAWTTDTTEQRPLLLATANRTVSMDADIEAVLLGCTNTTLVADVDVSGIVTATGPGAPALNGAQSYRLSFDEAKALMDRLLAATPAAEPELITSPKVPTQTEQPTAATAPKRQATAPPIPHQASGATPVAPEAALTINILGPLQVKAADRDVTALFRPLTAAILIQLALNPRGITRTAVATDLWPEPDLDPNARAKRFKATLSHVRTALADAHGSKADHIREARPARLLTLNPHLITVDAWSFGQLLDAAASATTQAEKVSALLEAINLYRGPVAHGHEYTEPNRSADETWLAPQRGLYLRKLIDAHIDAAAHLRATNPDRAIDFLEHAAELEPWNYVLSEQIIEIHMEQGQHHAAVRRLATLTDHLTYLGMRPNPAIVALVGSVPAD